MGAADHDDDFFELSFGLERNLVEVSFMSHKKQQCRDLHKFFRQRVKSVLHGGSALSSNAYVYESGLYAGSSSALTLRSHSHCHSTTHFQAIASYEFCNSALARHDAFLPVMPRIISYRRHRFSIL